MSCRIPLPTFLCYRRPPKELVGAVAPLSLDPDVHARHVGHCNSSTSNHHSRMKTFPVSDSSSGSLLYQVMAASLVAVAAMLMPATVRGESPPRKVASV
jgi:hypothetical protein